MRKKFDKQDSFFILFFSRKHSRPYRNNLYIATFIYTWSTNVPTGEKNLKKKPGKSLKGVEAFSGAVFSFFLGFNAYLA
ncbi:hypothetical protein EUGRSUZ_A02301 [Eucalyptus grandis]|uniref:Uncharacterized protein n=2 Tax=Eucalyptus grandis TaxID=71139 RepID=A0A059DI77_EUCGR|nr:hypothetical protein EUGRSUZ_A02301 [Eucalyptus grandis]